MRLFRSITLMLVLLTTIPIVVVGLILTSSTVDIIKTLTWELQQERVERASRAASSYFENMLDDLDLLLASANLRDMQLDQRQRLLRFILQKRNEINIVGLFDSSGRPLPHLLAFDSAHILPSELSLHQQVIADTELDPSEPVIFSDAYRIQRKAKPSLAVESRNEAVLSLVIPVDGGVAQYLVLELSLAPLQEIIERVHSSRRGRLLLLGSGMQTIADSVSEQTSAEDIASLISQLPRSIVAGEESSLSRRISGARPVQMPDGRQMLVSFSPILRPNWRVVSFEPLDDVYLTSRRMMWKVLLVVGISLVIAVGLGILFVFGLTRPIGKLVRGSLDIARGEFGTQLEVKARNELSELAHTFNYMSSQLLYYDQQNQDLLHSLERGYVETLRALANSIDAKDPYTAGHSDRVTNIAVEISRELGVASEQQRILRYAGILHDIGKIGIPEAILGKKSKLNPEELELMRQHPVLGEKIIEPIDFLQPVRMLVRHHHEWYDGSGYPDGLSGNQIPLGAQIIAAADFYDAVTSDRPYQKAMDDDHAIAILNKLRGRQIMPEVCDALVQVIEKRIAESADGLSLDP